MKTNVLVCFCCAAWFALPLQASEAAKVVPLVKPKVEKNHPIHLNQASAQQLLHAVSGIGQKRAEAIVAYREAHHGFKSLDELAEVKGLGKQYVQKHRLELEQRLTLK